MVFSLHANQLHTIRPHKQQVYAQTCISKRPSGQKIASERSEDTFTQKTKKAQPNDKDVMEDYKAQGLTKPIEGQPSSAEIRQRLKDENRPVCVAFSGGKDAIAATLALHEAEIETKLCYLYCVPGRNEGQPLGFIENTLNQLEDAFEQKIYRYPHPTLYRWINNFIFQPPERCQIIEAADLPDVEYDEMWQYIREDLQLQPDTWVADGVRAADSLVRRASIKKHGAMKLGNRKVSPVYDWLEGKVYDYIKDHKIPLPVDYEMFDRSFDGIDYRFLKPVKDKFPEDYEQILNWFPLAELEILRNEL